MVKSKYDRRKEVREFTYQVNKIKNEIDQGRRRGDVNLENVNDALTLVRHVATSEDDKKYTHAVNLLKKSLKPYFNTPFQRHIALKRKKKGRIHQEITDKMEELAAAVFAIAGIFFILSSESIPLTGAAVLDVRDPTIMSFSIIIGTIMILISLITLIRRK